MRRRMKRRRRRMMRRSQEGEEDKVRYADEERKWRRRKETRRISSPLLVGDYDDFASFCDESLVDQREALSELVAHPIRISDTESNLQEVKVTREGEGEEEGDNERRQKGRRRWRRTGRRNSRRMFSRTCYINICNTKEL